MESQRASKKQRELLQFIDGFIKGNGYGPSYREIMRALGYKSVSTVAIHVDGLITRGYLRKKTHSARSLEVVTLTTPTKPELSEHEQWLQKAVAAKLSKGVAPDDQAALQRAMELLIENTGR